MHLSVLSSTVKGRKFEELMKRRIPITRDQSTVEVEEEKKTMEDIKKSQKEVEELLWVVTRSRPGLMLAVSRMGSI